ncbi:aspartate/glutamate racemase family protein [Pinibacter aurantiacus]|uniref:Aspartate/glutamate racemase family protein n=1 Tax=Pinibacter aurantiacus TaxID=2851599 RepID=A0A9E2SEI1_9BACT|nr:aspartate/glutamate racemase family protein [Pinibacter aurantiacus]MBV4360022.1 aspartate/glutamate racemase family protein [Pinibacter aurantiacus]
MKILGLIGGISWVSTVDYYKLINEGVNKELGDLNFAECMIYSFNYEDIKRNNEANDWDRTFAMLSKAAEHLQNSGASAILLCASTMHMIADKLQAHIQLPVIHIGTVTADAIQKQNIKKVGLLGTKFTMECDFFTSKLAAKNIEAIIPDSEDREFIHHTIFYELGKNVFLPETKQRYLNIISKLIENGAEGIILGCTEIPLLIRQNDVSVPVFNTTLIHAEAAVQFALDK